MPYQFANADDFNWMDESKLHFVSTYFRGESFSDESETLLPLKYVETKWTILSTSSAPIAVSVPQAMILAVDPILDEPCPVKVGTKESTLSYEYYIIIATGIQNIGSRSAY